MRLQRLPHPQLCPCSRRTRQLHPRQWKKSPVTGTRIVRKDYEATSPVVTVGEETFKLSGEPQIETVLNQLPQLVASITTTSNNPSNGGQANVDLRGLGTTRTLVLVDGARVTPSNVNGVVDLNTIPQSLIESVEV
jgi:outer membrane cobalamin receptor